MYLLVVVLPLVSSCVCGLGGRYVGSRGASLLSTLLIIITFLLSSILCYEVILAASSTTIALTTWISSFQLHWGLLFDSLTVMMVSMVTLISALVHVYSIGYMAGDPHLPRFMSYLSLFTFCMVVLVTADNLIQLFVGWEGVGIVSYLLINFWSTRLQATKSAMKAISVNRIGDLGLILAMVAIYAMFQTLDFATLFSIVPYSSELNGIALLLFIGAVGKSAQIGLHMWLPDAMEGPTPVSALIHAATMVTAGVFLILRGSVFFEQAPLILSVVTVWGALTVLFAASTALVQNDLKKVIAYSTCSQLGYMVCACGVSHYSLSFYHLMTHGFFKALLFLGAGAVIHGLYDEQDMRAMGGVLKVLPLTAALMIIGSFSLMGGPFLSGFYSKESILEVLRAQSTSVTCFAYVLATLSALFTAFYSFRLISLTFLNRAHMNLPVAKASHEPGAVMLIPLVVLAFASIFLGYLLKDGFIGLGTGFWNGSLMAFPQHEVDVEAEFLPWYVKLSPVVGSLMAFGGALWCYHLLPELLISLKLNFLNGYRFLNGKWYFDNLIHSTLTSFLLYFGYHITFKEIDRGILEVWGPYGLWLKGKHFSKEMSQLQTGWVYHYAFLMILGITSYLAYFLGELDLLTLIVPLIVAVFMRARAVVSLLGPYPKGPRFKS